ncbi:MAG: TlpA family protein disulfide reductase [Myxococcales bacterium]
MKRQVLVPLLIVAAWVSCVSPVAAQSLTGLWDAVVRVSDVDVPFRIEFSGSGRDVKGSLFNGDERLTSSSGTFDNGTVVLSFDEYETRLEAKLTDGVLEGQYLRGTRGAPYPFRAKRFTPPPADAASAPAIAGLWNVQVKSAKGESAWQMIVRQSGAEASAAILRVDGDTGTLTGRYADGRFVLSHFSGARPLRLELTPQPDGTLTVVQNNEKPLTAVRSEVARAKGLPEPSDPSQFTSVKDPTEPLRFNFPDLNGRSVSNVDERFRGKVMLVNITGSWCPNCHDEVPFLVELYRQYRNRGLEIVGLSFEEAAQLKNPTRLKAFIKRYGVEYPVLLAGEPKEAPEKLPQAVNLNSFPTTFFVGRDGRVRGVTAGFPGKASGKFHDEAKAEVIARIERMLAEPVRSSAP